MLAAWYLSSITPQDSPSGCCWLEFPGGGGGGGPSQVDEVDKTLVKTEEKQLATALVTGQAAPKTDQLKRIYSLVYSSPPAVRCISHLPFIHGWGKKECYALNTRHFATPHYGPSALAPCAFELMSFSIVNIDGG